MKSKSLLLKLSVCSFILFTAPAIFGQSNLAQQVKITRTEYGVPHIQAENMKAAGMGLGYVQIEDYGEFVVEELIRAKGEWVAFKEIKNEKLRNLQIDRDATQKLLYQRAVESYPLLKQDTRDFLEGYAEGINLFIKNNPEKFSEGILPDFTGVDIHARGIDTHKDAVVKSFLRRISAPGAVGHSSQNQKSNTSGILNKELNSNVYAQVALNSKDEHPDAGSNTWALAPSRIADGNAVLLRNPHLDWVAGYYEAHISVPDKFDFYGDFRAGDPIGTVGGFNRYLGFSTTNNYPKTSEIYALKRSKNVADAYILDSKNHPLIKKEIKVGYKINNKLLTATRTLWVTEFGPVIYQDRNKIYIIKSAREGEFRIYEQFLEMMKARNLEEYKTAMRINAKSNSNLTYADIDGNIFYVWNGKVPDLPVPSGDGNAVEVTSGKQIWSKLIPWDSLPQLLNPKGGYLHNENDPFYFTNLNEPFRAKDFPAYFPNPELRLRSQLSIELIGGTDKMTLEEVVRRKHDLRILLADRVKPDLMNALNTSDLSDEEKSAAKLLADWDNTVSMYSHGSVLFVAWWNQYVNMVNNGSRVAGTAESAGFPAKGNKLFRQVWTIDHPATTPYGLANPTKAATAFRSALKECKEKYGTWDLPWGKIHRAVIGGQDLPVGGATGELGAFRVLWYTQHRNDPSKMEVTGGDGWILAVEFNKDEPKAYSILAYGNSILKDSPYYGNQLNLFTHKKLKPVFYNWKDVQAHAVISYHPGEDVQ